MSSSLFAPAEPATPLGRLRILSPSAGAKVSPLCLGAMNFGDSWKQFMGDCDKKSSMEMLDFFYESGGNFIDTSNNYQDEESEIWIGEWMKKRDNRDEIFLATKYTSPYKRGKLGPHTINGNYVGNSHKHLHVSVEASLKKMQTDYIDLLYLHWWDFTTGVEEVMQSLNRFVQAGKVLYLGISDTPAWIVAKANDYARQHGLKQFSVYQGHWSVAMRDLEREVVDMCQDYGMAIAPWGTLGRGQFKTEEQRKADGAGRQMGPANETYVRVSKVLEKIATAKSTTMTSVALAYVMHAAPNVFPIVGGRKISHLKDNIEALKLRLTEEEMDELEQAYEFDYGFPKNFLYAGQKPGRKLQADNLMLTKSAVRLDMTSKVMPAFVPQ